MKKSIGLLLLLVACCAAKKPLAAATGTQWVDILVNRARMEIPADYQAYAEPSINSPCKLSEVNADLFTGEMTAFRAGDKQYTLNWEDRFLFASYQEFRAMGLSYMAMKGGNFSYELSGDSQLQMLLCLPKNLEARKHGLEVAMAICRTADDRIFEVVSYVVSGAMQDNQEAQVEAVKMFRSIAPGRGVWRKQPDSVQFTLIATDLQLKGRLPAGYVSRIGKCQYGNQGLQIARLMPVNQRTGLHLVIYPELPYYPLHRRFQADSTDDYESFMMFGQSWPWKTYRTGDTMLYEAILPVSHAGKSQMMYVAAVFTRRDQLDELEKILAGLRLQSASPERGTQGSGGRPGKKRR